MDMQLKGAGVNDNVEAQIDPSFQALRASLRPLEYQGQGGASGGGHFGVAAQTGLTTVLTAGSILFSFRWSDSARLAMIHKIIVSAVTTTAFGTAQALDVDAVAVRGFTASDTSGTAVSMSSNSGKKRTAMANSLVADMRIASTTAVAAGTGTADTNPFSAGVIPTNLSTAAVGATGVLPLFQIIPGAEHGLLLGANEGFRLRVITTQGATGVVRYTVNVDWAEIPSY